MWYGNRHKSHALRLTARTCSFKLITMSTPMIAYGSLRLHSRRGYNHDPDGQRFIRFVTLPGWDLVSLGMYPCVVPGNGVLKAELHEVNNGVYGSIRSMELSASYREVTVTLDDGTKATMFCMRPEQVKGFPRVESGDWD